MKRVILLISILVAMKSVNAQGNLVPNPSFEFHTNCPNSTSMVPYAAPWVEYNSADFFDSCATDWTVDVPLNAFGYQQSHTGFAHCGFGTFLRTSNLNLNYREFIQVRLTDTLKPNTTYCMKYFVSVADSFRWACSNVGVCFSTTAVNPISFANPQFYINYSAQVENDPVQNPLNNTTQWVEVTHDYMAQGGEQYITIGNFRTDSNLIRLDLQNGSTQELCYLFIDDVSVVEKIVLPYLSDTSICLGDSITIGNVNLSGVQYTWFPSTGLSDSISASPLAKPLSTTTYYLVLTDTGQQYCLNSLTDSITIFVEDCTPGIPLNIPTLLKSDEIFFVTSLPENSTLEIFDSRGRLIFKEENYQNDFSVVNLAAGIYLYELKFPDQTIQTGKFCVVK